MHSLVSIILVLLAVLIIYNLRYLSINKNICLFNSPFHLYKIIRNKIFEIYSKIWEFKYYHLNSFLSRHSSRSAAFDFRRQAARRWPNALGLQHPKREHTAPCAQTARWNCYASIIQHWPVDLHHLFVSNCMHEMQPLPAKTIQRNQIRTLQKVPLQRNAPTQNPRKEINFLFCDFSRISYYICLTVQLDVYTLKINFVTLI